MGKNVIISTLPNISQNYLPKVNTSNIFANSLVYDDGSSVLINTTTASAFRLDVNGTSRFQGALTGTSATFSGSVETASPLTIKAAAPYIQWQNASATRLGYIQHNATNLVYNADTGIHVFNQALSGTSATFSGVGTFGGATGIDNSLSLQISSNGSGTAKYIGINKNNSYGLIIGYNENTSILSGTGAYIRQITSDPIYFYTSSTNLSLTLASTGAATFSSSVSVGAAIAGRLGVRGTTNDSSAYSFEAANSSGNTLFIVRNDGLSWFTGNVGIGNTNPNSILETTATSNGIALALRARASDDIYSQINFYNNAGTNANGIVGIERAGTNGGSMYFYTKVDGGSLLERMRITSGGNVGIGTTSPSGKLDIAGSLGNFYVGTSGAELFFTRNENNDFLANAGSSAGIRFGAQSYLRFDTGTTLTERMRITSGGTVLVGTTSTTGVATGSSANPGVNIGPGASSFQVNNNSNIYLSKASGYTSNDFTAHFVNGTYVGGISTNGSSTTYATSSDYRLKTDLKDFVGIDIVKLLNVYDYQWVLNKSRSFGVLAHELQSVLPDAVTGVKDGEQMQGVDYSKLTPILVKAIQEQQAQIEEQKADIESLKALINK